ncbi:hypothetical protein GCM10012320_35210 [Sinomonas cellulolyticus]|uniref:DUF262 domain-containing protein n=1 Tax=Sinomonas cellulolyticus TaxID=2801916 RepID=A0ABS1K0N0_9MICC|nr:MULTISPECIES: DUF262 domain-containing protein [Sinomonas]MBL0705084.1 DUF262 domain-containing protein [Sinomonas cellulolyticus]GHG60586.1 hypothetical protein GCM10012320_35210 [Sinomonas sp. KCTC 49339]
MKIRKSDLELETIVRRINDHELDLQPDFQRGEVWDAKRRQRLVDTILRSWYVPAVHIVVDADDSEVVLDGQQRLVAIRNFFADEVKVDGTIQPHDDKIRSLHGLKYSELPPAVRRAVNRFELQIIKLTEYEPQEPNELFFRLNQAYNLTPPEKRNALHGEARDQVKQLVGELTDIGLLESSKIGFTNGRLAYDDIIARTCVALDLGTLRQHINNNVVEEYYRSRPFTEGTVSAVRESGTVLLRQIANSPNRVKFNKGTLQSWMIYCHWGPLAGGNIPASLLGKFESDRMAARTGAHPVDSDLQKALVQILRQYDDRASYRVTDVSSVLIRDLAVHLYAEALFGTKPHRKSNELLSAIIDDPEAAGVLIAGFLDDSQWGDHLTLSGIQ